MEPTTIALIAGTMLVASYIRNKGTTATITQSGAPYYDNKVDKLARIAGFIGPNEHYDLTKNSRYRPPVWMHWPDHEDYFYEVYNSWSKVLPKSATLVVFAHAVKAQGWAKQGTGVPGVPNYNNLGAWASANQSAGIYFGTTNESRKLRGQPHPDATKFTIAKDPKIGEKTFLAFDNWNEMLDYYLSRFNSRSYLLSHFGTDTPPSRITERQVQLYMHHIKRWLSSSTDPDKFGSTMYSIIKRCRNWV